MFMKMYDEKRKKMQKPINQIKSNKIKNIKMKIDGSPGSDQPTNLGSVLQRVDINRNYLHKR